MFKKGQLIKSLLHKDRYFLILEILEGYSTIYYDVKCVVFRDNSTFHHGEVIEISLHKDLYEIIS